MADASPPDGGAFLRGHAAAHHCDNGIVRRIRGADLPGCGVSDVMQTTELFLAPSRLSVPIGLTRTQSRVASEERSAKPGVLSMRIEPD